MTLHPSKLFAALAIGLGCAGSALAQKAEVIHWWTSGGEAAAIKQFADMYTKMGGTWVDTPIAGGGGAQARTVMANRTMGGDPPTAAQFNYGTQYEEYIKNGLLNNIDDIAAKNNFDKILPPALAKQIKVDGHWYAVPVNIHNENWVWYNKDVLAKAGVSKEPATMPELFAAMDKIKAKGMVPLALGGQTWQEAILFRSVLFNVGGKDLYLQVFGKKDVSGAKFRQTMESFKKLKAYVDPGSPGRDWNLATAMVIQGKAGFQFMGDWAKGEFINANKKQGKDFGCMMAGGPQMPYSIGGDVFVFPKTDKAADIAAQKKLADMMISPAGQVAFNNKKGSIPVRSDVDLSGVDECTKAGLAAVKEGRLIESADALLSQDAKGAFEDEVSKFWNSDRSVDDSIKAMAAALKR